MSNRSHLSYFGGRDAKDISAVHGPGEQEFIAGRLATAYLIASFSRILRFFPTRSGLTNTASFFYNGDKNAGPSASLDYNYCD